MPAQTVTEARAAYEERAWTDAFDRFAALDGRDGLAPDDVERFGVAAYMTGRLDAAIAALERVHHATLEEGDVAAASHWAVWLALLHFQHGRAAQGGGWLGRAERLLDRPDLECPAQGLLLVPAALGALGQGDHDAALGLFQRVAEVADRFDDAELRVAGLLGRGQALVAAGQAEPGLALLDEAMVAVTTEDVFPILSGIVYCAVIISCRQVFDLRRAQEWTDVLSRWCDDQQDLKPYRGQCLVHRSEILQLHGDWPAAMAEIEAAADHLADRPGDPAAGMARYQHAELLRLQGAFADAEQAYREAADHGHPPQPGLALLRLAQGRVDAAEAAIRRVVEETEGDRVRRAGVLAAYVEIMLACGDVTAAEAGVGELETAAATLDSLYLQGLAAHGRGLVALARDDASGAHQAARRAWTCWRELDAAYDVARARTLLARACLALGDHDTAELELDAAQRAFEELGAAPALAAAARLRDGGPREAPGGLTPREIEVLREVATGATNREVAATLVISERTVGRHLSNIFTKLGVGTRAAATAWAYEHDLV